MSSTVALVSSAVVGLTSLFFIKKHFNGGTCTNKARLDGKIAIVTGANTGLGKETVMELARRGATVIMACRDTEKANRSAEEIRSVLGPKCKIIVHKLDLALLESVRQFAKKINAEFDSIELLINNAGLAVPTYIETPDGFETTMGTNHLGHFLLTNLLLDKIKKSAPSRIVTVSSIAHKKGKLDVDNLFMSKEKFDSFQAYRDSKLANILFTKELAERLRGSGVTAYSLHPGVVRTEIFRNALDRFFYKCLFKLLYPIIWLITKSCSQGAQTTVHCATEPELSDEKYSGLYFSDCAVTQAIGADDRIMAKQLWVTSERLTMR